MTPIRVFRLLLRDAIKMFVAAQEQVFADDSR